MSNHRIDFLVGVLVLSTVAGCIGCAGTAAREEVLLPTLAATYVGVRGDISRGVAGDPAAARVEATADALGDALSVSDRDGAKAIGFLTLRPWAEAGVSARVAAGEISAGVGGSLLERIRQFAAAMARL